MKSFMGRGFHFPIRVDGNGSMEMSDDEDNIQQSIHLVLGTAKGERLYRPQFGCAIHDLVFQPNNQVTASRVATAVKESLLAFEPRIMDIEVSAAPDTYQTNLMNVHIQYVVRALNKRENMVYPFYLRREDEV